MSSQPYSFPFTGGFDRSTTSIRADRGSFIELLNLRQSRDTYECIEQTARFYNNTTLLQGTYWNGAASATEPATSQVRWRGTCPIGTFFITDYSVRYGLGGAVQLKTLIQTAAPTSVATTTGCLLRVDNLGAMSVQLGKTYDVVIDGAGTFKWRVNAGAYVTLVAINLASGNLIDGGAIHLYWRASTGFNVGDTWTWERSDRAGVATTGLAANVFVQTTLVNDAIYYVDPFSSLSGTVGRVMSIRLTSGGDPYVVSVGYRPVYANAITFFEHHLVTWGPLNAWASSDLDNYDDFIATDVNEADSGTLLLDTQNEMGALIILGGSVIHNRLFVYTTNALYYSDYAGLPTPLSFKRLFPLVLDASSSGTGMYASTENGDYILGRDELYFFDGGTLKRITRLKFSLATGTVAVPRGIVYDPYNHEVLVATAGYGLILVYQEAYQTWYKRSASFPVVGGGYPTYSYLAVKADGTVTLGSANLKNYQEDGLFAQTPAYDSAAGTAFATPTIATQLIGSALAVSESSPVHIAATSGTGAAGYSSGSAIKWKLYWRISNNGTLGADTTDTNSVWDSSKTDNMISYPRLSYNYISFMITVEGSSASLPPANVLLRSIETAIDIPDKQIRR